MAAIPFTASVATRGWTILKRTVIFLGSVIALGSYRYLFGAIAVPPAVLANRYFYGWLLVHAAGAATALLIGPLQFMARLRQSRPRVHRVTGVVYVGACVAGGLSALPLAIGTSAGPFASAGFIVLAAAWIGTTVMAVARIRVGEIAAHRRWMMRSFALTLAAVTLRIYLPVSGLLRIDYFVSYPIIAWACWLPNLLAVEWYLAVMRRRDGWQS
jgi:uncharacterized membrane protein